MNELLSIIQLILVLFVTLKELEKRSISIFLWATLLILFSVPHFFSVMFKLNQYRVQTTISASVFVVIFSLIFLALRFLLNKAKHYPYDIETFPRRSASKKAAFMLLVLLCLSSFMILYVSVKYFGGVMNASWGKFYMLNLSGEIGRVMLISQYLLFCSGGVFLYYLIVKNRVGVIISGATILFYVIVTGNRVTILPLITGLVIYFVFYKKIKISIRNIIILGVSGFLVIYLIYFLRTLRIFGGFANILTDNSFASLNTQVLETIFSGEGELSLRNVFYYFIERNNEFPDFNKGYSYIRLLFIVIPDFLIDGGKPSDFAISMGSAWLNDFSNTTYSTHPTLFGDIFANFYWYGFIIGPIIWVVICELLDYVLFKSTSIMKIILGVNFATMLIIVGRGSVYNGILISIVTFVIVGGISIISRITIYDKEEKS
ncbi:O-antigen polymerase [Enterococcus sp. LJL128]